MVVDREARHTAVWAVTVAITTVSTVTPVLAVAVQPTPTGMVRQVSVVEAVVEHTPTATHTLVQVHPVGEPVVAVAVTQDPVVVLDTEPSDTEGPITMMMDTTLL